MPNFSDILDKPASGDTRPPPIPVGTYLAIVRGLPEYFESAKKKTPGARFTLELLQAGEDVDPDELEAMGGIQNKTLRHDIWLTDESLWRGREFCEHCGVDVENLSRGQAFEACNGAQVMVEIRHEPAQDGSDAIFARIAKTRAVE